MGNITKIMKKEELDLIASLTLDLKNLPNNQLIELMDKLSIEFEDTKVLIINSTLHLDTVEALYNKILKEYDSRN